MATLAMLPLQYFAGNSLDRSALPEKPEAAWAGARIVCVSSGRVFMKRQGSAFRPLWISEKAVERLADSFGSVNFPWNKSAAAPRGAADVYLLGRAQDTGWCFAIDIPKNCCEATEKLLAQISGVEVAITPLRSLLSCNLDHSDAAIIGQASALSSWHNSNLFCSACGAASQNFEFGRRRICFRTQDHASKRPNKVYPRTDPVAITLILSADCASALLIKYPNLPLWTCCAGFVDQAEGVEECVRREMKEELGVGCDVEKIRLVGSQPWPAGRGGSCELMIGAVAILDDGTQDVRVDQREIQAAKWFSKDAVQKMLSAAKAHNDPSSAAEQGAADRVPGPFAIAHHLLALWASITTLEPIGQAFLARL